MNEVYQSEKYTQPTRRSIFIGTLLAALVATAILVTIVLPVGKILEGFRVPRLPVALALIRGAGGALYVTSANLSGRPPASTAAAAKRELAPFVRVALDGGPCPGGRESTVVKVEGEVVSVLREGVVSRSEIELCIGGL